MKDGGVDDTKEEAKGPARIYLLILTETSRYHAVRIAVGFDEVLVECMSQCFPELRVWFAKELKYIFKLRLPEGEQQAQWNDWEAERIVKAAMLHLNDDEYLYIWRKGLTLPKYQSDAEAVLASSRNSAAASSS